MPERLHLLELTPTTVILQGLLSRRYVLHSEIATAPLDRVRGVVGGGQMCVDEALLARLPAVEIAAVHGVGYDGIDLAAARARGVRVTTTPAVLTDDVADLAIGLMLAVQRRIAANDAAVRAGHWAVPLGRRASGRTIGVFGLGAIGRAIAVRAAPFAREVIYCARAAKPDTPWRHVLDIAALAAASDVLILSAPSTPETRGIVGAGVLEALGPAGVLINVARGALVDEAALIVALENGRIAGAGLDVYADEPEVPDALRRLQSVVLAPHQGSNTLESRAAMADLVVANLDAHFDGRPLPTPLA